MTEQNKLGVTACVSIMIGGMIGSAIYSLSGLTIYYAGPACLISWVLAAVIMFLYALQVAELSTVYPKSGGTFVFPAKALGRTRKAGATWGWISTWCYIIGSVLGIAFSGLYLATYLGASFPAISSTTWQIVIAIIGVAFCVVMNLMKVTDFGKFNNWLVGALIITMLIFIAVAWGSGVFSLANFQGFFTQGVKGGSGWLSATPIAICAYGCAVAIAFMVSDVRDPNKTVPKSMLIAMLITVVLYVMTLIATIGLLNATQLQELVGTMGDFVIYVPMFAAVWTVLTGYAWLGYIVSISAALALITSMLVGVSLISRALQASADGGFLPKAFSQVSKNGVPGFATIITGIICAFFCFFPGATEQIINLGALFTVLTIAINCITVVAARRKAQYPADAFHAPGGKAMPIIVLLLLIAVYVPDIVKGNWTLWAFTGGAIIVGLIIMALTSKRRVGLYEEESR